MASRPSMASPLRSRTGGTGDSSTSSPAILSPFAWYDAQLGGSATQITDSSPNARAAAAFGAAAAQPLYLPYTGTPYVHLEAAGTGTNSISCTAPAGTASYSALPLGGAATTGAAAPGAFTFTTAGDWLTIELLNGSAVVLARYSASESTQTGHTGTFGITWTVNRGTAGRKTVVFGPVAHSTRSLVLFGTNDTIVPPAAAFPTTTAQSILVVCRQHATVATNARLISNRASSTTVGFSLYASDATNYHAIAQDGAGVFNFGTASPFTPGNRHMVAAVGRADNTRSLFVNNAETQVTTTPTTWQTGTGYLIGANAGPANYADMQFSALLTFDRALTASEVAQIATFYDCGT